MLLACAAMLLALVLGIALGLMLAWQGDGPWARAVIGVSTLGMSAPSFFVAILVAWGLGVVWHDWTGLPASGGWRGLEPFEGPKVAGRQSILPPPPLGTAPSPCARQSFSLQPGALHMRSGHAAGSHRTTISGSEGYPVAAPLGPGRGRS